MVYIHSHISLWPKGTNWLSLIILCSVWRSWSSITHLKSESLFERITPLCLRNDDLLVSSLIVMFQINQNKFTSLEKKRQLFGYFTFTQTLIFLGSALSPKQLTWRTVRCLRKICNICPSDWCYNLSIFKMW